MLFQKDLEIFISSNHHNYLFQGKSRKITLSEGTKTTDSSCLTVVCTHDLFRILSCGYLKVTALVFGGSCVFSLTVSFVLYS